jgi:hypothetical protein
VKILTIILILLATLLGAAWFWLSRNMDDLVKDAIQSYGSTIAQAKVSVDSVKLSPTDGKGSITGLTIGNPPGFKTAHALKVAQVEMEVDLATVAKEVVRIRQITVVAPDVIYEKGAQLTNFDALSQHIAHAINSNTATKDNKPSQKLIVDVLTIQNAQAQASAFFNSGKTVALTLPAAITLKNLGRDKGGLTPGELAQEVTSALKSRLGVAASVEFLVKSGGSALSDIGSTVKGWFK